MEKTNENWRKKFTRAGQAAYDAGKNRDAHPFSPETPAVAIQLWQHGWDTGSYVAAVKLGANAEPGDPCPYADPALAAYWRRGWHAVHELTVIAGTKTPPHVSQPA